MITRRRLISLAMAYVSGVLGLSCSPSPTPQNRQRIASTPIQNWHQDGKPYRSAVPWWKHPWLKDKVFVDDPDWGIYGFVDGDGNFYPVFKAMPTTQCPAGEPCRIEL